MLIQNAIDISTQINQSKSISPDDIDSLTAWYDATEETYNDNDPVSQWSDLSGNGYHLTQATEAKQPTYLANQINGLPTIKGDGVDDSLQVMFGQEFSQPNTIIIVSKLISNSTGYIWVSGGDSNHRQDFSNLGINSIKIYAGSPIDFTTSIPTDYQILTGIYDGVNSKILQNNSTKTTGDVGADASNGITLFNYASGNYATEIYMGEFLFYNKKLNSDELDKIHSYLSQKWGIAI